MDGQIKKLEIPEQLSKCLKGIGNAFEDLNVDTSKLHITGCIELKEFPVEYRLPSFFLECFTRFNSILENLNIVLTDLIVLKEAPYRFQGSSHKRLKLLFRLFFYEFYRLREVFNEIIGVLAKEHYIEKKHIGPLRQKFHGLFEDTMKIRNVLTHSDTIWRSDHIHLSLGEFWNELGYSLVNKETGEKIEIDETLEKLCIKYHTIFSDEGNRISCVLQDVMNSLVKSLLNLR